ncbi:HPr kinase/phosphorylase [Sphingomonas rubra]|uniref:Hpr(Ser) kinase/phosphatase n=1 Tax=Sphingomonas rubra TaxID=634430 RepID=A0A1I5PWB8_9SPHN|nr:HPr kinase/phosphatase C-terminal domain-containing protein [Sphingomonas rubra]SFP38120.1 Hpr(Ser) kinase/phosphatase [Sphingomonas rubra]
MADQSSETIHASTVAIDDRAVLIRGRSGSGKSDLALRLIDRGATLVSDDYTLVARHDGLLVASAPSTIAGKMEVRGIGIVTMPAVDGVPVALSVCLDETVPRMPDPRMRWIMGISVREIALDPFEASTPLKVELALRQDTEA